MSDQPVIKRFIAGAVCPACTEMDTIRTYEDEGRPARECVNCGYADTLDERGNAVPREVPTRVSKSKPAPEKKVQTVQFFPNPKLKKK
ncbi:YheV family putative zinc ribbon protein [uncultured Halopseudomonas sp.]|uniref:YheV family putative zinc ribbon protein n=1 Tax=uncultured Halopseudomonas sp. TaxID=2901193 RepID=UPI0030EDD009|tara:strand:+ start:18731 stop:18994 length:264 start_codon:yes stop_codon:yes gene_type:complete